MDLAPKTGEPLAHFASDLGEVVLRREVARWVVSLSDIRAASSGMLPLSASYNSTFVMAILHLTAR